LTAEYHVSLIISMQMLRPEIDRLVPWWTYVGAVSGGALGYIVGNLPGMVRKACSPKFKFRSLGSFVGFWRICG
jgi:hypothetical protein